LVPDQSPILADDLTAPASVNVVVAHIVGAG